MKRLFGATAVAVLAMLGLTACDPPMPPSVAAQIAEQTFTCLEGDVKVAHPSGMVDLTNEWLMSMQSACTDPVMTFSSSEQARADLVLSAYPVTTCTPVASVPVAVEAADIAFSLSYSTTLYLSPKTLAAIFNGEITNWSDKQIVDENPDTEMPDQALVLRRDVDRLAFDALKTFTEHNGHTITESFNVIEGQSEAAYLEDGEVALLPHSIAFYQGATTASMIQPEIDGEQQLANADGMSIGSAATQWKTTVEGDNVSVELDYGKLPEIQAGLDTASPPYQLIYPIFLNICNDSLVNRAVAFFFLRMDSQGSLAASVYTQLPESTRVVSLVAVKRGLPVPTATPQG